MRHAAHNDPGDNRDPQEKGGEVMDGAALFWGFAMGFMCCIGVIAVLIKIMDGVDSAK
jgi:hypothetical protein